MIFVIDPEGRRRPASGGDLAAAGRFLTQTPEQVSRQVCQMGIVQFGDNILVTPDHLAGKTLLSDLREIDDS